MSTDLGPGVAKSKAEAGFHAGADLITLGLWELFAQMDESPFHSITQAAVGYDPTGRILCVIPEFGDLDEIDPVKCAGNAP